MKWVESASFGYDKGFFIAHDSDKGSFKMKIQARLQSLLVADSTEGTDSRQDKWAFSVNRARLTFSGHAFTKKLEYKFQSDFGKGFVTLKDFYLDAELADSIWLRAGRSTISTISRCTTAASHAACWGPCCPSSTATACASRRIRNPWRSATR